MIDLQKASLWKRVSAALFDFILLAMLTVGAATGFSAMLGYDGYLNQMNTIHEECAVKYNVTASAEEIEAMSETELEEYEQRVEAAEKELSENGEFMHAWNMVVHMSLLIATFSVLFGVLLLEFVVPLMFGNGQTLGKKIFGVALMRIDGVKVFPLQMFIRSILGKFAVELMIPIFLFINLYFNGSITLVGIAVLLLLAIAQIICLVRTRTGSLLHDVMAGTVAVDMASQMIFESPEARIKFIQEQHEKEVASATY